MVGEKIEEPKEGGEEEQEEDDEFDITLRQTDRVGRQPEYTRQEMLHYFEV